MTACFGPDILYERARARFAELSVDCDMHFGWQEPAKHRAGDRIVWVPGDPGGRAGDVAPPRSPGGNPRPLATLNELVTVYVSSDDATAPESELAQYRATRTLFDLWYAVVRTTSPGVFRIEELFWDTSKNTRRRGTMLVCVLSVQSAVFDAEVTTTGAAVSARFDVETRGVVEVVHTPVEADDGP